MRERGGTKRTSVGGDLSERNILEDLDVDGRIILILIFKKWDG